MGRTRLMPRNLCTGDHRWPCAALEQVASENLPCPIFADKSCDLSFAFRFGPRGPHTPTWTGCFRLHFASGWDSAIYHDKSVMSRPRGVFQASRLIAINPLFAEVRFDSDVCSACPVSLQLIKII